MRLLAMGQRGMHKKSHSAIEHVVLTRCVAAGSCRCAQRPLRTGMRLNRRLCDAKYVAVVREVIDRFLHGGQEDQARQSGIEKNDGGSLAEPIHDQHAPASSVADSQ